MEKFETNNAVKDFFAAFGAGDFQSILDTFHPEVTITAIREAKRENAELYGTYKGSEGVASFLKNLGNTFDSKLFEIQNIVSQGYITFANGSFAHQVKRTGKMFISDWVLYAVEKDGKIFEYHFYEDSAKFEEANTL